MMFSSSLILALHLHFLWIDRLGRTSSGHFGGALLRSKALLRLRSKALLGLKSNLLIKISIISDNWYNVFVLLFVSNILKISRRCRCTLTWYFPSMCCVSLAGAILWPITIIMTPLRLVTMSQGPNVGVNTLTIRAANDPSVFTITVEASTRAFSWLTAPTC